MKPKLNQNQKQMDFVFEKPKLNQKQMDLVSEIQIKPKTNDECAKYDSDAQIVFNLK